MVPARKGVLILYLFLFALGVALRVVGLEHQSLSVDEVAELRVAGGDPQDLVVRPDGFPPLYQILLHAGLKAGSDDGMGRYLSVVFGCLALIPIWDTARSLAGARAGMIVLLLSAASPLQIWHSQEGRAYALYFFAASIAIWAFFRSLKGPSATNIVIFIAGSLVGLYTHYYFAILLVTTSAICLFQSTSETKRRILGAHGLLAALSLPLVLLVGTDVGYQTGYSDSLVKPSIARLGYTYFTYLHGMGIGVSQRDLHWIPTQEALYRFIPWIALTALVLAIALTGLLRLPVPVRDLVRLASLSLLPNLATGALSALAGVSYKPSYVLWASIPLLILVAIGLSERMPSLPSTMALLLLLLVSTISLLQRNYLDSYRTEDSRGVARYLQESASPDEVLLVTAGYMETPLRHYLGAWPTRRLPLVHCDGTGAPAALEIVAQTASQQTRSTGVRMAYTRTFHSDPCSLLLQGLTRQYDVVVERAFAGIELFRLRHHPSAPPVGSQDQ